MQAPYVREGWLRTAELDFGVQDPPIPLLIVADYLKSAFGIDHTKLDAFFKKREESNQVFRVVFRNDEEHRNFIDEHAGTFEIKLGNKMVSLRIYDASIAFKIVRIIGLPPYVDLRKVEFDMTQYGVVQKIEWQRHLSKNLEKVKTDTLKVQMILSEPIPWFIHVDSRKVRASYEGQVKTCSVCNSEEHLKKNCPQIRKRKVEAEYDSNFPALGAPCRVKQNPWFTIGRGGSVIETEEIQDDLAVGTSIEIENADSSVISPSVLQLNAILMTSATEVTPAITGGSASNAHSVKSGRPKKSQKKLRDKESRDIERSRSLESSNDIAEPPYIEIPPRQETKSPDEDQVHPKIIDDPLALAQLIREVQNAPESLLSPPAPDLMARESLSQQDELQAGQRFRNSGSFTTHISESQASDVAEAMDISLSSLKRGRTDEGPPDQPPNKQLLDEVE